MRKKRAIIIIVLLIGAGLLPLAIIYWPGAMEQAACAAYVALCDGRFWTLIGGVGGPMAIIIAFIIIAIAADALKRKGRV